MYPYYLNPRVAALLLAQSQAYRALRRAGFSRAAAQEMSSIYASLARC